MIRFFGKLDFIHRRLWQNDGRYRVALLCGPAPLAGCLVATALWAGVLALSGPKDHPSLQWAVPHGPKIWSTAANRPQKVQPAQPLLASGANGKLAGYESGWQVTVNPIEMGANLDVDLKPNALKAFFLPGPDVDMAQMVKNGPPDSLYVGVGSGFLAIKTAGVYALSVGIERPASQVADCLLRLGLGPRRIVSVHEVGLVSDVSKRFEAAWFELEPGLYPIGWAFGCWHDHQVAGPGRMTLLIEHPGEPDLAPARPEDIVRPERVKP